MTKEADLYSWAVRQAELLRAGRLSEIDAAAIAEEIDDVGEEQYDRLESALRVLMLHLLKWDHQPDRRSRSWTLTIRSNDDASQRQLRKEPGAEIQLDDALDGGLRRRAPRGGKRDRLADARLSREAAVRVCGDHGAADRLARRRRFSIGRAN